MRLTGETQSEYCNALVGSVFRHFFATGSSLNSKRSSCDADYFPRLSHRNTSIKNKRRISTASALALHRSKECISFNRANYKIECCLWHFSRDPTNGRIKRPAQKAKCSKIGVGAIIVDVVQFTLVEVLL